MRHQPPNANNPSNPLFKVVALSISKETTSAKKNQLSLACSLNFKKSNSVTGHDKNIHGSIIQSVTFSLSVKRAVLSIQAQSSSVKNFQIDEIAHQQRAYRLKRIETESERRSRRALQLAAKLKAQSKISSSTASASGNAGYEMISGREDTQTEKSKDIRSTVSGTHDWTEAHWEIEPNIESEDKHHSQYISGELFRGDGDSALNALIASWEKGVGAYVDFKASVWVEIGDLNISNVRIVDAEGEERRMPVGVHAPIKANGLKMRLVKQLLKKHLLDQGLARNGSYIEVCRAYG